MTTGFLKILVTAAIAQVCPLPLPPSPHLQPHRPLPAFPLLMRTHLNGVTGLAFWLGLSYCFCFLPVAFFTINVEAGAQTVQIQMIPVSTTYNEAFLKHHPQCQSLDSRLINTQPLGQSPQPVPGPFSIRGPLRGETYHHLHRQGS